jgi:hypothetical protein
LASVSSWRNLSAVMLYRCLFLSFLFLTLTLPAGSQQNCPLPPSLQTPSSEENIFSDQQEVDLGDAMAETVALHVNVIQNDELTAHLRELGNRLVQYLPPTKLSFRFYLIDLPQVNAFSIAGGRVYISRKIIAFARDDGELAGVLAHELGHIVTHQSAIKMSRSFREVLGVTQVGDRDDIFRKFHQYVENVARQGRHGGKEGERHQLIADQVEVFALARAGFNPQAAADIWDRLNELHGKTGGWFSDLFGATTEAQHRLRDMIKNLGTLPTGCSERATALTEPSFKSWQATVVDYDSGTQAEILPGLISKHRLSTRLRSEITNLRFSPNGKYILAEDDGGIHVASRDPFAFLFYIPAPDAREARFSPDSNSIVFANAGLRVEIWSVPEQKRKSVHEITVRDPCLQTELSPDGSVLACLNSEHTLQLIDVMNGSVILEEKDFWHPTSLEFLSVLLTDIRDRADGAAPSGSWHFVNMAFTPDGHYFLAAYGTTHLEPHLTYAPAGPSVTSSGPSAPPSIYVVIPPGGSTQPAGSNRPSVQPSVQWYAEHPPGFLMFDLTSRSKMSAPASIKNEVALSFSFLGPDRFIGIDLKAPQKSHILKFPSGEVLGDVEFWSGLNLRAATHGDFLLVGPLKDYPLGVMDLATKESKIVIKQNAADIYDGVILTEQVNGQLALRTKDNPQPIAVLPLPEGNLGRLRASAASPDLTYLAASSRTRAAVWDIPHDFRAVQMRRFNAVGFDNMAVYVDLPAFQSFARQTAELHLDTGAHSFHEINKDDIAVQHGVYLLVTKPRKKESRNSNADLEVRDVRSGSVLWSRYFPDEIPSISIDPDNTAFMLRWPISTSAARTELQKFPQLKHRSDKDYLSEVLDAKTGSILSAFVVSTNDGSLRFLRGRANAKWAVMEASGDQVITYALPSGEEQGHFFGSNPVLSLSGLMAVDTAKREVTLHDLSTLEARQQYTFAQPVACKAFSADGKRLLVFTSDQTVYLLDTASVSDLQPALPRSR